MQRREFPGVLGGAAVAWPRAIHARARLSRTRSRALRLFWQLRMGDTAFLRRAWLAGPPGASVRLIRDYGENERLIATIDVERRPSK
jgi:hypothetical protein